MDVALGTEVFIHPALVERHPSTRVSDANALPHCGLQSNQGQGGALVLWCFKTTWEDESKTLRGDRDGCGWEQLSGSKAPPRELESFLLAVRNEGSSWICGSTWRSRGLEAKVGGPRVQGWLGVHGGDPVSKRVLIKPNYQLTNQEAAVRGRLFYVATEPTS